MDTLQNIWQGIANYWRLVAEISILSVAIYYTLKFFRGTRGWPMVVAFLGLLIVLLICIGLELTVLSSLLNYFFGLSAFAALIIFQPELRRLLAGLGNLTIFTSLPEQRENIEVIIQAVDRLSEARTGALIAIEQSTHLQDIIESGIMVDCEASPEMIETIFFPNNAIHDGGVIINEDRILSAACIFPLTRRQDISKTIGTRHRAAIGMSEESDSLVIAVSEETGAISTAYKGQLIQDISLKKLRGTLNTVFVTPIRNRSFKGWIKSLKPKLSGIGLQTKATGN
ncbi:MAG: diadenylate cyclase CdaA [Verrucomicrobiota bacterium]|nr:diadenylate cyclase CdaA [Verrucomicrobiota bacterium]